MKRSGRHSGFTLLELLVVLAILALLLAVIPPMLPNAIDGAQIRSTQRELISSLRYAKNTAITTSEDVSFILDVKENSFSINDKKRQLSLPANAELKLTTAKSAQLSETAGAILFYSDGSSTGGQIKLSQGEAVTYIDVDWLTGKISLTN